MSSNNIASASRIFTSLPDVFIQDPHRDSFFFIPKDELIKFEVVPETWSMIDSSTVTFVIPDDLTVDEIPAFIDPDQNSPSVLIQYRLEQKSFFLSPSQLADFRIYSTEEIDNENTISFLIPIGWELIERLSTVRSIGASACCGTL